MPKREEFAVVLDFLPQGKAGEAQKVPIAQVVGETYFTLLELVLKPDTVAKSGERLYIGASERDKVDHIKGRVLLRDLTNNGQKELEAYVKKVITEREAEFVGFINRAGAINIHAHSLEHLPGIGKKHLGAMLDERDKKPFESYADIQKRVPHLTSIGTIVFERIMHELAGDAKYYLFCKPPFVERERI